MSQSYELKQQCESQLKEYQKSGDSKGCAETLFQLAQLEVADGNQQEAMLMLMEAYNRFQKLGDARGHCFTGELLGQLLFVSGNPEDGLRVVRESLAGFRMLGLEAEVQKTEALLSAMEEHIGSD